MSNKENEFNEYIDKLKEIYQKNPSKAIKEARNSLIRLSSKSKEKLLNNDEKTKFYLTLFFIFLALIGLVNISSYFIYIFGLAFFAAGVLVGLYQKGFGIIFLFSHGLTGLTIMIGSSLGNLFSQPIINDAPLYIYILLGIIILLILIAIISTLLYNLSDQLKTKKNFIFIPLFLFGIAIIISIFLAKLLAYKYGIVNNLFFE